HKGVAHDVFAFSRPSGSIAWGVPACVDTVPLRATRSSRAAHVDALLHSRRGCERVFTTAACSRVGANFSTGRASESVRPVQIDAAHGREEIALAPLCTGVQLHAGAHFLIE